MGQVTLISGRERRRRWSGEDRSRISAAISAPGAVVAEIARREDFVSLRRGPPLQDGFDVMLRS